MIKILMADDHGIVREGMKHLFAMTVDIKVVAEAQNGAQVMECLDQGGFDMILLDMSMPGISGVNLITRIRAHSPELPILVLSMHNESQIAMRALKAGANGYLTKDRDPELLLSAIRKVAQGKRFIDPMLAEQVVFEINENKTGALHEQLTERELQILLLLSKGKRLNDIADELVISSKTVSTHKMRIMQKMHFNSNADLIRYAVANGLVG